VREKIERETRMFDERWLQLQNMQSLSMRWRDSRSIHNADARTCVKFTVKNLTKMNKSANRMMRLSYHRTLGVLKLFKKYHGQATSTMWRSRMRSKVIQQDLMRFLNLDSRAFSQQKHRY
jgi:hypothetical protein